MAEHRALLIEHAARLSVDHGRLRIERSDHPAAYVAPCDIGVLVLHHPAISLTGHVLQALAEDGAMVLVTDRRHLPGALLWPWSGHVVRGRRLRQQIELDGTDLTKELWASIVRAKIEAQAATLRYLGRKGALYLERLVPRVVAADPENREAQAARHYWKHLLPPGTKRQKQGAEDPINSRLNFGYAVLRSLVARALAVAGLEPALGLGHRQMENPFNLADDFMEPYRCVVDRKIIESDLAMPFDGAARVHLLAFMEDEASVGRRTFRLPTAVTETVNSFCRVLDKGSGTLRMPKLPCRSTVGG